MRGNLRSIAICRAPPSAPGFLAPRSFFSRLMAPPPVPSILKRPMRVRRTTSLAESAQTIASQLSRRASRSARIGVK